MGARSLGRWPRNQYPQRPPAPTCGHWPLASGPSLTSRSTNHSQPGQRALPKFRRGSRSEEMSAQKRVGCTLWAAGVAECKIWMPLAAIFSFIWFRLSERLFAGRENEGGSRQTQRSRAKRQESPALVHSERQLQSCLWVM